MRIIWKTRQNMLNKASQAYNPGAENPQGDLWQWFKANLHQHVAFVTTGKQQLPDDKAFYLERIFSKFWHDLLQR